MQSRPKEPTRPPDAHETFRKQLCSILEQGRRSAKELSGEVGIPEKEVYDHLEHLRRSKGKSERRLSVIPAECRKCGFVFSKRERLRKPGKCPVCKGESIHEPLFSIE